MTNILRDVVEDAARGRCYLPAEWLGDEIPRTEWPTNPARFRAAFDQVHAAASARYRSARGQIAALSDADARRGVTMIHDSYHILHRLIAGLPDRGWRGGRWKSRSAWPGPWRRSAVAISAGC